jgi:hypothetical protein
MFRVVISCRRIAGFGMMRPRLDERDPRLHSPLDTAPSSVRPGQQVVGLFDKFRRNKVYDCHLAFHSVSFRPPKAHGFAIAVRPATNFRLLLVKTLWTIPGVGGAAVSAQGRRLTAGSSSAMWERLLPPCPPNRMGGRRGGQTKPTDKARGKP